MALDLTNTSSLTLKDGIANSLPLTDLVRLHDGFVRLRDNFQTRIETDLDKPNMGFVSDSLNANIHILNEHIQLIEEVLAIGSNMSIDQILRRFQILSRKLATERRLTILKMKKGQSTSFDRSLMDIENDIQFIECILLKINNSNYGISEKYLEM